MNQILFNKEKNNKIKYIFKVQFVISIIVAIILITFFLLNHKDEEKLEELKKHILSCIIEAEKQIKKSVSLQEDTKVWKILRWCI